MNPYNHQNNNYNRVPGQNQNFVYVQVPVAMGSPVGSPVGSPMGHEMQMGLYGSPIGSPVGSPMGYRMIPSLGSPVSSRVGSPVYPSTSMTMGKF